MATFRGLLEVEGDPDSSLVADVAVDESMISIRAGSTDIGSWNLNDIEIEESGGSFRIIADNEVLILRLSDAKRFAGTVGTSLPKELQKDDLFDVPRQQAHVEPPGPDEAPGDETIAEPVPTAIPGPDETPLVSRFSWSLAGAAVVLFFGAALDWGPWRLMKSSQFSLARALTVLAGVAALAAAYLGLAGEKRRDVAVVAMMSGLIAVLMIVLYSREAGIGYGFIITILGSVAVISLAVLALSHLGAAPPDPDE
jgi:hypothetical protein